jgi:hypothetical protein
VEVDRRAGSSSGSGSKRRELLLRLVREGHERIGPDVERSEAQAPQAAVGGAGPRGRAHRRRARTRRPRLAAQHGAAVLHVDHHYDVLAAVLTFTPVRADGA